MKKYLVAAGLIVLSAGAVSAQSPNAHTNTKGIGAEVRADAHAQHDSAAKGIGTEVSTRAKAQRTTPAPTPTPTPSPSPTPTSPAPTGPTE